MPGSISVSEPLAALWSDGHSSRVWSVNLTRHGDLLQAELAGGEPRQWPLADIRISPRLARSTLLSPYASNEGRVAAQDVTLAQHDLHQSDPATAPLRFVPRRRTNRGAKP